MYRKVFAVLMCCIIVGMAGTAFAKVLFRRPLVYYNGVYKYYDHGGLTDWGCGSTTYSGHHGTDYVASVGSPVIAGASGNVYHRVDVCPDNGYIGDPCGGYFGNHVRIQHADGRVSIYAHMKKGTPIWYGNVSCGWYIGQSASSGSSDKPHLHFEVWLNTSIGARLDPYKGQCDSGESSDWVSQGYYPNGNVSTTCLY